MSTNSTETIVTVALTTALTVSVRSAAAFQSVMSNDAAPAATVHLLVRINGTLDDADVDRTRATARALLASAGIHTDWRECRSPGPCNADPMGTIPLVVELLPASKPGGEDVCGEVVRHPITRVATILIYIVQIHKLRLGLQVYGLDRANPRMALITNGHLVGMTIAHEVGHALGVPHSRCGVMQAKLGVNDVVDLRRARLTFTPQEAAVMRQALVMK